MHTDNDGGGCKSFWLSPGMAGLRGLLDREKHHTLDGLTVFWLYFISQLSFWHSVSSNVTHKYLSTIQITFRMNTRTVNTTGAEA